MDIQKMMQQAQIMQDRMQDLQAELTVTEVQGQSGGGMVNVTITCGGMVKALKISPEVVNSDDKETLEDLVIAAFNNARENADELMAVRTQELMKELGLPAGASLPGM